MGVLVSTFAARTMAESEKLWEVYLYLGGSLDPEPDTQSPFFDSEESSARAAYERPSLRS
jgi:hypothetical protein